jgi:small subunit ribosomal protein S21
LTKALPIGRIKNYEIKGGESLTTQILVGENEGLEGALKRFKRKCQKDGIIADIRRKVEYTKPSVAKKVKSDNARKRARKESRGY